MRPWDEDGGADGGAALSDVTGEAESGDFLREGNSASLAAAPPREYGR